MSRSKRIFVTGGTGMVGSYLLRYLVHLGYSNIIALRRENSSLQMVEEVADNVEWVVGDLLDTPLLESVLQRVDQVFHCAAQISFDPGEFDLMKQVNVEGTANLVNLALHTGLEKLVFVSTIETLGRTNQEETLDENKVWLRGRFNTNYSITKYLAEQEVWRGQIEGLNTAIVNPSVILGSGKWNDGPLKLFPLVWKGFPFYTTGISGFVDVRDVARFMIRLMESPVTGERFILSGENLPFRTIMNNIAGQLGKAKPRFPFGKGLRELSWRAHWPLQKLGMSRTITRETTRLASYRFYMDNGKSLRQFPDFSYTPIPETISETASQFREAAVNGFEAKVLPLIPL